MLDVLLEDEEQKIPEHTLDDEDEHVSGSVHSLDEIEEVRDEDEDDEQPSGLLHALEDDDEGTGTEDELDL